MWGRLVSMVGGSVGGTGQINSGFSLRSLRCVKRLGDEL